MLKVYRLQISQAGVYVVKYHGCPKYNAYVWTEQNKSTTCGTPGCSGKRFDEHNKPHEEVYHFPIKGRLQALVNDSEAFYEAIQYVDVRPTPKSPAERGVHVNQHIVTDVYDSQRWPMILKRGLLYCCFVLMAFRRLHMRYKVSAIVTTSTSYNSHNSDIFKTRNSTYVCIVREYR